MGVIEDGVVKGKLPSKKVFVIHYPGYPSSMSRAVETLGGVDAIGQVLSSDDNKLELHFRPEDPLSHPVFSKILSCNSLLLRISKNNGLDSQIRGCSGSPLKECGSMNKSLENDSSSTLCADIVARVKGAYHFNAYRVQGKNKRELYNTAGRWRLNHV